MLKIKKKITDGNHYCFLRGDQFKTILDQK